MNDRISDLPAPGRIVLSGFVLDLSAGELLTPDGRLAGLRKQALEVLLLLGSHCGTVVTKDELMRAVWPGVVVGEGSLTQAIADIRKVLGDTDHRLVRNVARRGYMLAAEMAAPAAPGHPQARPWTRHPKLAVGSALSAMLLAAALWVALSWPFGRVEVSNLPSLSIAVLPLAAEGSDADSSWFADALHGDLTAELGQLSGTSVTSRETAATFKGKPLDPRAVARELQVRYVVQGSVRREANRVGLRLTMIDGETGTQHWTERFEMDRAELGPSLIDIARRVARSLSVQMYRSTGERSARLAPEQARADDLAMEGFSIYFRGVTPENLKLAGERFDTALRLDPHSVRAWGGIQTINGVAGALAWIPRDRAVSRLEDAARRLNELDQDHYFTHSARLFVAFLKGDWEAQLMLSATATERFASHPAPYNLRALAQAALGQFDECIDSARRAIRLGPRDSGVGISHFVIGTCHFMKAEYPQAATAARLAHQVNPALPSPPVLLAAALARSGEMVEARAVAADYLRRHPSYKAQDIGKFLRGRDARYLEGRDRVIESLRQLGMP